MKRYSIMVYERGSDRETELCQVDGDPQAIAAAAARKCLHVDGNNGRRRSVPKYDNVRVRENSVSATT